ADRGTIVLYTDASSHAGTDRGSLLAQLRAKGVNILAVISGDCAGINGQSSVSGAATLSAADCPCCNGPAAAAPAAPAPAAAAPAAAAAPTVGPTITIDEPPNGNIDDVGQTPFDDRGNSQANAFRILVNTTAEGKVGNTVRGFFGGTSIDAMDFFVIQLDAG